MKKKTEELLEIVSIGNVPSKTISVANFPGIDQFKTYIYNKSDSSTIVILSNDVSFNDLSVGNLPQVCAVYNENFDCLYLQSEMVQQVEEFLKYRRENQSKCSSANCILPLIKKYWFLIGLLLSIILAYLFPNVGKKGGYIRSEWTIKWGAVIIIFFLSGLSLRTKQLGKEALRIHVHSLIQIYSLLIIPFSIYGVALLLLKLSMNKLLIFGLIIMGSTSTTISSNVVMTKNALGNEYTALLNAVAGNLLGIFVSPALIFYFMKDSRFDLLSTMNENGHQMDYEHVIRNLTFTVLIPLIVGQIIHLSWTQQVLRIRERFYFTELNSLALLTLVWAVFCTAFATGSFTAIHAKDLAILVLLCSTIYIVLSLFIMIIAQLPIPYWKYSREDTIAIMFCGATKTLAMGIPLINALYGDRAKDISGVLSLPLIIYHASQLILGAIEVIILKKWAKKLVKTQGVVNDGVQMGLTNKDEEETDRLEIKS